jgi:glycosyltransferase involved in cell wall biosynthesis
MMTTFTPASGLSIVLPVHNEAPIVAEALREMCRAATTLPVPFEIVVCENGSRDDTLAIVHREAAREPRIMVATLDRPDYGHALQHGIQLARYDKVVIFNVDYWSAEFLRIAVDNLAVHDMVNGSKVLGHDERPILRRLITRSFNQFLRLWFGFQGTDTHGMKAFRRDVAGPLAAECVSRGWVFDTELVIRAERHGLRIVEQPVDTIEVRAPSYRSIVARVPETLRNIRRMRDGLQGLPRRRETERRRVEESAGDEASHPSVNA